MSGSGLQVRGVEKRYGATRALRGVDLIAPRGQITGIVGANGAGKSTLMKVLAGEERCDAGTFTLDANPLDPLRSDAVAIVHQEPFVYPNLTVGENLSIGRELMRRGRPVLTPERIEIAARFHLDRELDTPLERLPFSFRQRVEIARAMDTQAEVFLFDEPNSALGPDDSAALLQKMAEIAAEGKVVCLISHRLSEVAEVCDSVVVIKDGLADATLEGDGIDADSIATAMMMGSTAAGAGARAAVERGRVVVDLASRGVRNEVPETAVRLHGGEVVAVVGLEGSGSRAILAKIADDSQADTPSVFIVGDRKASLVQEMSVEENLVIRDSGRFRSRWGLFDRRKARSFALDAIATYRVRCSGPAIAVSSLSGGNQQKVAIAAGLAVDPTLLVVDEPTRGIDLDSRREIHQFLRDHAGRGNCVVFHTSEENEVPELADRVLIVRDGTICEEFKVAEHPDPQELAALVTAAQSGLATTAGQ
ncbi:ATP-binding cassette domain-containing protein [Micromonospora sp. NPDC049051]|uniref:ATP-binding cassette domain-containing protein n=1 Tax=Micromonospora sp. NPDC049051 TaxID=3364264 RepID=UPI00371A00C3